MKGRKTLSGGSARSAAASYKIKKSVMQNIPVKDVDIEGGFLWASLIPILKAIGIPILGELGKWMGSKIFKPKSAAAPVAGPGAAAGSGINRSGDKRPPILIKGGKRAVIEASDIPLKIPQHTRSKQTLRSGDIPLQTKYIIHGLQGRGIDISKLKTKLMPFIKANDPIGFRDKILKTIKKKVPGAIPY